MFYFIKCFYFYYYIMVLFKLELYMFYYKLLKCFIDVEILVVIRNMYLIKEFVCFRLLIFFFV